MFTSGTAGRIYLKFTAFFSAVLISIMFVIAPILPTLMNLIGLESFLESFLGIEMNFGNETGKPYVNVLLLGVDKSERLSDVMMVAQLNMVNNSVNILQIPRDTYIKNNRSDKKLNSAFGSVSSDNVDDRVTKTMEEIKTLIDIDFDGYVLVTTSGFRDVIDAVGGIEYDVPRDMNYDDDYQDLHIHLKKGLQLLDGSKAEQYVRYRSGYATGDLGRIDAQSDFIKEAMRQILEKSNSQTTEENNNLLRSLGNMVSTNFEIGDMLKYAPYILKIDMEKVNIMRLEGVADMLNGVSYFLADREKNDQIIYDYFSPDTSEIDLKELEIRDCVKEKTAQTISFSALPQSVPPENETSVYLIDYSGTNGESLEKVRNNLTNAGYKIVGNIEARTCYSDRTYCVCKEDGVSAGVAKQLGFNEYVYNYNLDIGLSDDKQVDVVVIIGKDI